MQNLLFFIIINFFNFLAKTEMIKILFVKIFWVDII